MRQTDHEGRPSEAVSVAANMEVFQRRPRLCSTMRKRPPHARRPQLRELSCAKQEQSEPIANRATGLAREYRLAEFGGVLQLGH